MPELSPDGKFVGGRLILSSSDGALVSSLEADKLAHPWSNAKWTTDGESLIYLVTRGNTSNVWVQSLSGSAPGPLTNFRANFCAALPKADCSSRAGSGL